MDGVFKLFLPIETYIQTEFYLDSFSYLNLGNQAIQPNTFGFGILVNFQTKKSTEREAFNIISC